MINLNAKLVPGRCGSCGAQISGGFLVVNDLIPMCKKCMDSGKTLEDLKGGEEKEKMVAEYDRLKKQASRHRYAANVKRRKARMLPVERSQLPGIYITGSTSEPGTLHVVTAGPNGIHGENNDCDCHNGAAPCSHVLACRLFDKRTAGEVADFNKGGNDGMGERSLSRRKESRRAS